MSIWLLCGELIWEDQLRSYSCNPSKRYTVVVTVEAVEMARRRESQEFVLTDWIWEEETKRREHNQG